MPVVRRLHNADHAAVLHINAEHFPAVARLDALELQRLATIGELHRVAVVDQQTVAGYLLAFARGAAYDGEEFRHFSARLPRPFLYIDQIAISARGRRQGIGRALYESLAAEARRIQIETLCCEVNIVPPNPDSLAFHLRVGFTQLDTIGLVDGRRVALLTRDA
jgi:predicted GNAT superfamily acetyltransferase